MSTKPHVRGWVRARVRLDAAQRDRLVTYYDAARTSPHRRTRDDGAPTILAAHLSRPDPDGWVDIRVHRNARALGNARWDLLGDVAQVLMGRRADRDAVEHLVASVSLDPDYIESALPATDPPHEPGPRTTGPGSSV